MKKAIVSVTNDLSTDQRVMRTNQVLLEMGYEPFFVGRQLPDSKTFKKEYPHKRFKLIFEKGFLFYAHYNLRLFLFLLGKKPDLLVSNDLDTLLPNFLISKLKSIPLIYDSHEYFTGSPEIQKRPLVKKFWTAIEKWIFPKLKHIVTVNDSISNLYKKEYGKEMTVVRNISDSRLPEKIKTRAELGLPENAFILINQGAGINVERGMEEMVQTMPLLPQDVVLLIVGNGDAVPHLKKMVAEMNLEKRVIFKPKQPYLDMLQYTLNADCGLSLDKPLSPNYQFSLPNKVFDYIKCGLPLVVSDVVEVREIVEKYQIGKICDEVTPQVIADNVMGIKSLEINIKKSNIEKAAQENRWEEEKKKLAAVVLAAMR